MALTGYQPHGRRNVVTPFGSGVTSYTLTSADYGAYMSTTGATDATTFTLPDPAICPGESFEFFNAVDENMTIKAGASSHSIACFNDAAATSVVISTTNKKVGTGFRLISDGTVWCAECRAGIGAATVAGVTTVTIA